MVKKSMCFLVIIFGLLVSCTNGTEDSGGQSAPKPPVEDPDKIKYSENLLDFSRVPLKQYLVQSKDTKAHSENNFYIFLNLGSAKGLEPQKYLETSYDINMSVELNNNDVTNTVLSNANSVCKLTYSGDHSCQIIFQAIKNTGVYTLKFSYHGININKQILLYVATRSGLFVDNQKDDMHIVDGNYNVDLQLKSNLPDEDLIVPLTYTEGSICITQVGDTDAKGQGTECIQDPKCKYLPQIGDLERSCIIKYRLLKGGSNHPTIEVNQTTNYLRRFEIPGNYEPFTCLKDGLELIKSKSDKSPLGQTVSLHINESESQDFTAFYCASDNTSQAVEQLSLDLNQIEPENHVTTDAFAFFYGEGGVDQFKIKSKIEINNGEYKPLKVKYNPDSIEKLKYFGSANVDFTVTGNRGEELGKSSFLLANPDQITFLRMGTEESSIDKKDMGNDTKSITVYSHNLENYREIFMKPDNLKYSGNSTLVMTTCFILGDENDPNISDKQYDINEKDCLISYQYTVNKVVRKFTVSDDANITVGYYPDRPGAPLVKLPRGAMPSDVSKDDLLKLKNGQHFALHIDATEVYPDLKASLNIRFYEENIKTEDRVHFTPGDLRVDLIAQPYLVAPENKNLLSFLTLKAKDADKADNRYMDKFYIRAIQGESASFKSHKIRFAILDKSASSVTIKGYHMTIPEQYDDNNRPITMADNKCAEGSCTKENECTLSENGDSSNKYCECTIPDTGSKEEDSAACDFELISSGQSDGDYVKIGLFDQKNRQISNQKIEIKYHYAGEDIKFRVRNTDLFGISDGKDIKNSVYFPIDQITQVKKDSSDNWNNDIFESNAFFNSSINMFVDHTNNMIHVINFPGKVKMIDNNSGNNIPEFYLWTNNACFNHNGTACSSKDDMADNMICTIPSGAITFSNDDFVQENVKVIGGTNRNHDSCFYYSDGKKYKINAVKHIPVLQSLKEGDVAKCDGNSYLYNYMKDAKYRQCSMTNDAGQCTEYDDIYTMITAKHRLNIHCKLSSSKHSSPSDMYDFALSQRTDIGSGDDNARNANSGICFGVKQQFLDDGNKDGDPNSICDGLNLK